MISIIMPSYNTASYIAESIESVLNQTYPNWELIIVDDCSTDNTDESIACNSLRFTYQVLTKIKRILELQCFGIEH